MVSCKWEWRKVLHGLLNEKRGGRARGVEGESESERDCRSTPWVAESCVNTTQRGRIQSIYGQAKSRLIFVGGKRGERVSNHRSPGHYDQVQSLMACGLLRISVVHCREQWDENKMKTGQKGKQKARRSQTREACR